jgi:hypothetical protein
MGGPVIDAAFKRAVLAALLVGFSTFFALLPQTDDWKLLVSGVGAAVVSVLIARLGIEGTYDLNRANNGNMNAGDVPVASNAVDVVKAA